MPESTVDWFGVREKCCSLAEKVRLISTGKFRPSEINYIYSSFSSVRLKIFRKRGRPAPLLLNKCFRSIMLLSINWLPIQSRRPIWQFTWQGHQLTPCSLRFVWLISRTFSANEQYFSLTPNQLIVLSVITYQPNKPKQTGRNSSVYCPVEALNI